MFLATLVVAAPAHAAIGDISTVAGTGALGTTGDGGPATSALMGTAISVSALPGGGYLIADQVSVIRSVAADGTITRLAGNGTVGFTGDGGPALSAMLSGAVSDAERMPDGSTLIADANNNVVRKVSPSGTITRVAGLATGEAGFSGDGGPATSAKLSFPSDIAATSDGGFLISDNDNNRIRKVAPDGIITTVAGTGAAGGADGPVATATINGPASISGTSDGGFLIAELDGNRIRKVKDGVVTRVAGLAPGTPGFSGDDGPATAAALNQPARVVGLGDGGFLIADRDNNRIREVSAGGTITTIAGTGTAGYNGDGIPATAAQLNQPYGVAVDSDGNYLIADTMGRRIRKIDIQGPPPPPPPPPPPDTPPPPPAATGPSDHALLGKVTYEPAFAIGDDRNSVLSPFVARPAPRGLTVTLVDSTGAAVTSRALTGSDIAASLYVPVLYRFDGLGACPGCALVLSDNGGVQDRVPVDFDGEAGQTDADLVYGRARTGGTVTGGVLAPSSIRAATLRVVVRGSDGGVLADTAKLRSCGSSGSGCRAASRYGYRLTGLPQAAVPVVAELDQQTAKGRFVAVDTALFALDASGATTVPDLTALADPPPDGSGRVLHGQMNVVAPFAPGAHTRSELDASDGLLRTARVELHAANGALVKRVTNDFHDGRSTGFTTYTMAGLGACSGCTMQLRRGNDLVDSVPVTVPARTPSVTTADLDFRDGKPAFIDGVVQTGTRAFPELTVVALDPLTSAVLASTPRDSQRDGGSGAARPSADAKLPYRIGGAPAGQTVLLALRSRSTILDSRLVELSPEGQVTQAPVLMVPRAGSGRVLQGAVYAAGPFGPGLVAASVGKLKLTVVLLGDDGAELARANVAQAKGASGAGGAGGADGGYALSGLAPCADCTVELRSGTTLEDRAAVTIRPEPAAVTVADLGAGAISGGAYVQGALVPRHGEKVAAVTVQVRSADGKVLADSAQIRGDGARPAAATAVAHPLYRLGGIPRDAGTVTVVVLSGRTKLASARVTIPVGAGDAHVPDLQIDVPKGGRGG